MSKSYFLEILFAQINDKVQVIVIVKYFFLKEGESRMIFFEVIHTVMKLYAKRKSVFNKVILFIFWGV